MGLALAEPEEDDRRLVEGGARVWVQSHVDHWYEGAELDWENSPYGAGFRFQHPSYGSC